MAVNNTEVKGINPHIELALQEVEKRDINKVFFVACGGSSALMYPSKYLMDREAVAISSDLYSANEFIHRNPNTLGDKSLVILCSMSGTTPETVEAAEFARNKGALTIALTHEPESPLAQNAEFVVEYGWFPDLIAVNTNQAIMIQLTMGVLYAKEGNKKFADTVESLHNLEDVFQKAEKQFAPKVKEFAKKYKDESNIYTLASGGNYGPAYSFTSCFLMEMQWIHSNAIHAGEYFHGPFEILDKETPFLILLGLDETRPLEERALTFSRKYGEKLEVVDAKELDLEGISDSVKGYVVPAIFDRLLRRYAEALAEERNHPLSTRRYMWKVEY